jgi:hypothetical protein
MREQVELTFLAGYCGEKVLAFEAACIAAATRLCGGCFVADGTGYWRDGTDRRAARFDGKLQAERTLCIQLTTELSKEAEVLSAMREVFATQARFRALNMRWVHVQRHAITGLHFSIDTELAAA